MNTAPSYSLATHRPIQLMLADDSAVIRGALSKILKDDQAIQIVAAVRNGHMAIQSAKEHQPDVIILDIEMPVMDGITALPEILKTSPHSKVIMFSSLTAEGADVTLKAFSLGAVECLVKPSSSQDVGQGSAFQRDLLRLIKNLGGYQDPSPVTTPGRPAAIAAVPSTSPAPAQTLSVRSGARVYQGKPRILAIGSSTGGPNALFEILKHCQGVQIPIVLTQHMPATFTKILARHITDHTGMPAVEGETGMRLENGHIYVAPGGFHMRVQQDDAGLFIKLDDGPPENFCKPSVEPMFRSVIDIYGAKVLGLILTGMGQDGIEAGKALADTGAQLIAQDEATSVVWGMPGAVAKAGYCTHILPLGDIGPAVKKMVMGL